MKHDFVRSGVAGFGAALACRCAVLSVAVLLAAAGEAAEAPSLLKKFEAEEGAKKLRPEGAGAFLLVTSPDGAGGAFLTTLWKQPVILTCGRAWLGLSSPEVCDTANRVYRIREVLVSRERDLVILGYEPPAGERPTPLTLLARDKPLSPGSEVAACGRWRSAAAGNIFVRHGRVVGCGTNELEMNIPFATALCGLPLFSTGPKVAGIITGAMSRPKFPGGMGNLLAVRVDNLTVDEFSQLDMEKLEADRALVRQINRAFEVVAELRSDEEKSLFCLNYSDLCRESEERDWSCEYFRREMGRKVGWIQELAKRRGFDREFREARIPAFLLRHAGELHYTAAASKKVRCFGCDGLGRVNLGQIRKLEATVDSGSFLEEASRVEFVPCRFCEGSGRLRLPGAVYRFDLPEPVRKWVIRELVVPESVKFCGLTPGCTVAEFFRQGKFYRKRYNLFRHYGTQFGETLVYRGNHRERRVAATTLEFQLGRLTGVTLLVRCRGEEARQLAAELLENGNNGGSLLQIRVEPMQGADDMPFDAKGNPLEQISYFDFTAAGSHFRRGSELFWVIRVMLEGKAGLDLVDGEALVRAGAKVRPVKTEAR